MATNPMSLMSGYPTVPQGSGDLSNWEMSSDPSLTSILGGDVSSLSSLGGSTGVAAAAKPGFAAITTPNLGFNIPTLNLGLGALNTIGGLYAAFSQLGLAKQAQKTQTAYAAANLADQAQNYNTTLSDRANSRAIVEGQSDVDRDAYIKNNSLKTTI